MTHDLVRRQQLISEMNSWLRCRLDGDCDTLLLSKRSKDYCTRERNIFFSAQAVRGHRCLVLPLIQCFDILLV